jgi:hypothetical protein
MKKYILCILLLFNFNFIIYAQDFFIKESCDFVSSYLYHGSRYGGFSIQPNIRAAYKGFYVDLWFNIGSYEYRISDASECDIKLGYSNYGLTIEYKHVSVLNESNCFSYKQSSAYGLLDLKYNLKRYLNMPIELCAYTRIAGHNLFHTYVEIKIHKDFRYDICLSGAIGGSTTKETFNVLCIEATLAKTFKSENFTYKLYVQGMINPYNINKENAITFDHNQHLNACIGISISPKYVY